MNGQQLAEQYFATFLTWTSSKSDEEFRAMAFRGQLNRQEVSKECGFSKSALWQNPRIKDALKLLEIGLRVRGILPPLAENEPISEPLPPTGDTKHIMVDKARLKRLESENASLRAELSQLRADLVKFKLMEQYMAETGRLPR
jgi:hypothetical protein